MPEKLKFRGFRETKARPVSLVGNPKKVDNAYSFVMLQSEMPHSECFGLIG